MKYKIAPSILSADFTKLGKELHDVMEAGADIIHFDVMDNHYVPNLSFGPMVCESIRKANINYPIDVHLMCSPVDNLIHQFIDAGANYISFHPEASNHVHRSIKLIKNAGIKAGLAFNPTTPLSYLDYIIEDLDLILLMTVNPGFGGQTFIENSLNKIKDVKKLINKTNKNILLEVDGGINAKTIKKVAEAGADTFVMGSGLFKSSNYAKTITEIRRHLNE